MNFNSLTIGKRITLGFAVVLLILVIIGGYAIFQMKSAAAGAGYLSADYMPEVKIASLMQSSMADVRVNGRSYQFTGDASFLIKGKEALGSVKGAIKEFESLAAKSAKLILLKEKIIKAPELVSNYELLLGETEKADTTRDLALTTAGKSAVEATELLNALISSQNGKMKKAIAEKAPETELNERLQKITQLNCLLDLLNAVRIANFRTQSTRETKALEEEIGKFQSRNVIIESVKPLFRSADDIQRINSLEASLTSYEQCTRQLVATTTSSNEVGVRRGEAANALEGFSQEISKAALAGADNIATASSSSLNLASRVMVGGVLAALVLGVAASLFIARSIVKILTQTAESLSEGSDQVASASGQISSSSQSLAEGASEQAASLEETSASLEEIASMTKRNAENALSAKDLSSDTRKAAETGSANMQEMNHAMADIQSASSNIAKIIKTIDEIAFQTNILALNAAVEAARAGEAGAGFAVVADEVRNLAQRSANAAKETAEKIEDSISKSANGVAISGKVTESLDQIVTKARQVDELVAEIATASREQSQGIDQVNTAVTQMDKVTQTNAAAAEESASASEELTAQAATLRELVGDLQTLVTGAGHAGQASTGPRREIIQTRTTYRPQRAAAPARAKGSFGTTYRPALGSSKKRNPEDEIPLEDGFKDF